MSSSIDWIWSISRFNSFLLFPKDFKRSLCSIWYEILKFIHTFHNHKSRVISYLLCFSVLCSLYFAFKSFNYLWYLILHGLIEDLKPLYWFFWNFLYNMSLRKKLRVVFWGIIVASIWNSNLFSLSELWIWIWMIVIVLWSIKVLYIISRNDQALNISRII